MLPVNPPRVSHHESKLRIVVRMAEHNDNFVSGRTTALEAVLDQPPADPGLLMIGSHGDGTKANRRAGPFR